MAESVQAPMLYVISAREGRGPIDGIYYALEMQWMMWYDGVIS